MGNLHAKDVVTEALYDIKFRSERYIVFKRNFDTVMTMLPREEHAVAGQSSTEDAVVGQPSQLDVVVGQPSK
eukprot:8422956-Karenia_brevis.AAC.1